MNYNNLIKSIEKISSDKGLNISQKRIVVSTSGIPKMIKKLADENLKVNLALSLHSAIEETRNKIMPFSKKFSLIEIKESLDVLKDKLSECINGNALSTSKGKEYANLIEDGNFPQALKILAIEQVILAEEAGLFPLE